MEITKLPGSSTAYRRQKQIEECLYTNLLQRPILLSVSLICVISWAFPGSLFTIIFRTKTVVSEPLSTGKSTAVSCT